MVRRTTGQLPTRTNTHHPEPEPTITLRRATELQAELNCDLFHRQFDRFISAAQLRLGELPTQRGNRIREIQPVCTLLIGHSSCPVVEFTLLVIIASPPVFLPLVPHILATSEPNGKINGSELVRDTANRRESRHRPNLGGL